MISSRIRRSVQAGTRDFSYSKFRENDSRIGNAQRESCDVNSPEVVVISAQRFNWASTTCG
jgi:hypothetical protein